MFKQRLKLYSYHTFLVVPFIVLFLYAHNYGQAQPYMTYRTLWIGFILTSVLFGLSFLIFKNRLKTGVFVTFLLFLLFQYGVVYEFFEDLYYTGNWPFKNIHRYLLFTYLVLIALAIWITKKTKHDFIKVNYFLNFLLLMLVVFNLININFRTYSNKLLGSVKSIDSTSVIKFSKSKNKPDIYYIILDGYAGNSVLKKYYNFNNNEFSNQLKQLNFSICDSAFSNYYYTSLSVAATLNMRYHDSTSNTSDMIKDNLTFKTLKANNYRIYHMLTGYAVTSTFTNADSTIQIDAPKEFEKGILKHTILRLDDLFGLFAHQRLSSQFKKMHEFTKIKHSPKFCFMHFVAPHPPFIFDREGQIRAKHQFAEHSWEPKELYIDQLIYVNKQINKLVESIVNANPNAAIIIQSDHGPWITEKSSDDVFEARSKILYAYRLGNNAKIPTHTSSVNTFRYLFNHLFNAQLDTLEDVYAGKQHLMADPIFSKKVH
jgi:hypothetical protein